jgi:hypothetical protein
MEDFKTKRDKEREEKSMIRKQNAEHKASMFLSVKATMDAQREAIIQEQLDRDIETFMKPHDNVPPQFLQIILDRKREIAKKHGWECDF